MIRELIRKKRDGLALTDGEIDEFISGCVSGEWADYQISAMLMAIFIRGMEQSETFYLTRAMAYSGKVCDLSDVKGVKVDQAFFGRGVGRRYFDPSAYAGCLRRCRCQNVGPRAGPYRRNGG